MPDPAEPRSSSSDEMVGDNIPTDGAKEVADAALPDTTVELDDQTKGERHDDTATRDPTKTTSAGEGFPTERKDSRRHVGKAPSWAISRNLKLGPLPKTQFP